jgi:hypothetical protein
MWGVGIGASFRVGRCGERCVVVGLLGFFDEPTMVG